MPFGYYTELLLFAINFYSVSHKCIYSPTMYTHTAFLLLSRTASSAVSHTRKHTHFSAGVIVLSVWNRRHYNSVDFQSYICTSPVCTTLVTTARSHTHAHTHHILMLLFEHKQHLQSYNAQSLMQRDIFSIIASPKLQMNGWINYSELLPGLVTSQTPTGH